jgi:hypothetical protein
VTVREHLIKTPESSLRNKSPVSAGADPRAVQEAFLAQQRKLQEKIKPATARGQTQPKKDVNKQILLSHGLLLMLQKRII